MKLIDLLLIQWDTMAFWTIGIGAITPVLHLMIQ
jgi:hypothetical protein